MDIESREFRHSVLKTSIFLSFILRHQPSAANVEMDEHGWIVVEDLITGVRATGRMLDRAILDEIVKNDTKRRYSYSEDGTKIRARQGHSIEVDVELDERRPPATLYHGTTGRFLESIIEQGLTGQRRLYVHLTEDPETAMIVGARHGDPILLEIDTDTMWLEGYRFYLSENGVWLCRTIPSEFILLEGVKII